jgi:hypothetical protein
MLANLAWVVLVVGLGASDAQSPGEAQPSEVDKRVPEPASTMAPEKRLLLQPLIVARPYPVGYDIQLLAAYQHRLYETNNPLLSDNHVLVGLQPKGNALQGVFGAVAQVQPTSFFILRATADYWAFFGTFGNVQSFGSPAANFSDPVLRQNWNAGNFYGTSGLSLSIQPTLQMAYKNFALRIRPAVQAYRMRLHNGDGYWYDLRTDALLPANGWTVSGDVDLAYLGFEHWVLGVTYSLLVPLYAGADAAYRLENSYQRIGPVVSYTFFDHGFRKFDRPTIFLVSQWFITHRYRTGAVESGLIPFGLLGFTFNSDLL